MAVSIDVNLPKNHIARFPNRCVVCNHLDPDSHVRIITGSIGWWTWLLWWFGKPFVVRAPACRGCGWKLHGLRWTSLLFTAAVAFAALWFLWPHVKESVPPGLQRGARLGLILLCLIPQVLVEIFYARPFDVTAFADSVDYEFTLQEYAIDFAMQNHDAEWVKVNGNRVV